MLFFEADPLPSEELPDRRATGRNLPIAQPPVDLVQRQVRLSGDQSEKPIGVVVQGRSAAPNRLGRRAAAPPKALHPLDRRAGAHPEPIRRRPA
jgi:hypothetical protein